MHKSHVVAAVALSCVVIAGDAPFTRVQSPVGATIAARTRCGAKQPDALQQGLIEAQLAAFEQRTSGALRDADESIVVPVHFHVITTASGGGNVSGLLAAQMDVINAAFAPAGFAFTLASQEVVRNDRWFFAAAGSPDEVEMKTKLRVGGTEALNIYTTSGDIYLGWSTFPHDAKHFLEYDGVVLDWAYAARDRVRVPRRSRIGTGRSYHLRSGRYRNPRDRPLARAVPHVRVRLLQEWRPHRGHARRG